LSTIVSAAAEEAQTAAGWRWSRADLLVLVLVTTYEESGRFDVAVHAGKKLGDHGQARCLGQVHPGLLAPRREWLGSTGTDLEATRVCMRLVVRVLVASSRCVADGRELNEYQIARIVTAYATGNRCTPIGIARTRARFWSSLLAQLRPTTEQVRAALDRLRDRGLCSPSEQLGAIEDLYAEPPGGWGGMTADEAAEALVRGRREVSDQPASLSSSAAVAKSD
jgi:hypothetical protein